MMTLRVRQWRERRKLTYRELADRAGVALSTLYRIESGTASPTVAMLERLATALEIELVDFFPPRRKPRRGTRRHV